MLSHLARKIKISLVIVLGILVLHAYSEAEAKKVTQLKQAKTSEVCMVNDAVMAKPQIPVPFEGKMYYGCCEGCVERIKTDRSVRYAKDPVSGKEVDKAKAFIMEGLAGEALYFESKATAAKYRPVKAEK